MTPKGPWSTDEIACFLADARIPLRLACQGTTGFPVLASLWFVPEGTTLWCATQRGARVVRLLEADARCAFEVAPESPPYRGVRGQGRARIVPDRGADLLERAIDRYLGRGRPGFARWLRERADTETAIAIEPERLLSWDFGERMGG